MLNPVAQKAKSPIDPFITVLLATLAISAFLPVSGEVASALDSVSKVAIAWLFFLYGLRLETKQAISAIRNWKLHTTILGITFILFPIFGLLFLLIPQNVLPTELSHGLLFLTLLPSTVQSSIAFTSIAKGDVASAIVSASFSNLLGIAITPLLVTLTLGGSIGFDPSSITKLALQLLAPFIFGQFARRWLATWAQKHKKLSQLSDRGTIILVVYLAFSQTMVAGNWKLITAWNLFLLVALLLFTLALALYGSWKIGKSFPRPQRIAVLMCGTKKSLATGLPMAAILLPGTNLGLMVIPLILFHQFQLIACSVIASKLAKNKNTT